MISYESLLKGITNVNDCSVIDVKKEMAFNGRGGALKVIGMNFNKLPM